MAIDFDGVDDKVDCGSPAHLDDLPNWTMCAWVRPDSLGEATFGTIMRKSASGPGKTMNNEGTNQLRGAVSRATTNMNLLSSNNTIVFSQWQFVAFTYDGTGRLYYGSPGGRCDEVTYGTNTQGAGALTSDATANVTIGNEVGGATTYDGRIQYPRWFKVALTADELTNIMYNRLVRMDQCVGDWWLDDLSGADWSGYAANGTVTGSPVLADGPPIPPPYLGDEEVLTSVAGADTTLSGTGQAAASVAAGLSTSITPAASPSATAATQANLSTSITLAAAVTLSLAAAGAAQTAITPAGTAAGAAAADGSLSTAIQAAAAAQGTAQTAAALTTGITLAAAATLSLSTAAALDGAALLAGAAAGAAAADGALNTSIQAAGAAQAAAAGTASLTTAITLAGAAPLTAQVQAAFADLAVVIPVAERTRAVVLPWRTRAVVRPHATYARVVNG